MFVAKPFTVDVCVKLLYKWDKNWTLWNINIYKDFPELKRGSFSCITTASEGLKFGCTKIAPQDAILIPLKDTRAPIVWNFDLIN